LHIAVIARRASPGHGVWNSGEALRSSLRSRATDPVLRLWSSYFSPRIVSAAFGSRRATASMIFWCCARDIAGRPSDNWLGKRLYSTDYQTVCKAVGTKVVCRPKPTGLTAKLD
jgi:hypothetical protein